MPFSTSEIQAAVENLIKSGIRKPLDTLGVRRTDITFSDVQQAAAGVFLLYPKSPFYCLYLGSLRILELILAEAIILDDLLAAINSTSRRVLPVDDVSPLFNAQAALQELGTAVSSRSSAFPDIAKVPAFQRFSSNVDLFLSQTGSTIKDKGEIVQTPEEARKAIPRLVLALQDSHQTLIQRVGSISGGMGDYNTINLSSLVAGGVISAAQKTLGAHASTMASLTPQQRLEQVRGTILDMIAAKALVKQYGSFTPPSDFYSLTGIGNPFSDSSHPALPASLLSNNSGGFTLVSLRNQLDVWLDALPLSRATTNADSISLPGGTNQAAFNRAAGSFVTDGVVIGDFIYVDSGPNNGTKWMVLTVTPLLITAQGDRPALVDAGPVVLEVMNKASVTLNLPLSFGAQISGTVPESSSLHSGNGYVIGNGIHPFSPANTLIPNNDLLVLAIDAVQYNIPLTHSGDATRASITGTIDLTTLAYGPGGDLAGMTFDFSIDSGPNISVFFPSPADPAAVVSIINTFLANPSGTPGTGFGYAVLLPGNFLQINSNTIGEHSRVHIVGDAASFFMGLNGGFTTDIYGNVSLRTAQQVCNDINSVLPADFRARPYFPLPKYKGGLDITPIAGSQATLVLPGSFGSFGALGVLANDLITISDGANAGSLWSIDSIDSAIQVTATRTTGAALAQTGATSEIGSKLRSIQLYSANPLVTIPLLKTLSVIDDAGVGTQGANTIGFAVGITSRSKMTTSKEVSDFINGATTLMTAQAELTVTLTGAARSEPSKATQVTFSKFQGTGNSTFTPGFPNTLAVAVSGALTAGVGVGDVLVTRSGANPGLPWTISAVSDTLITALGGSPGASELQVAIEVGALPPALLAAYDLIRIPSPSPNQGDYYLAAPTSNGIDYELLTPLPMSADPLTLQPVKFTAMAGLPKVSFHSKNITTSSYVRIRGTGAVVFFTAPFREVHGTTKYFKLPQLVRGVLVGDLLEFFQTQYNVPSDIRTVTKVDGQILALDVAIPSNVSWNFSTTISVPFARLHVGHVFDYVGYKAFLDAWLAREPQQPAFFTDLNRLINPLLVNATPKASDINDALLKLEELYGFLSLAGAAAFDMPFATSLEFAIDSFKLDPQTQVDTLIRTFKEKGSDRAIDLLTQGQFTAFFGMTEDQASYAGDFQAKMRDVVQNDLPLRKLGRADTQSGKLINSSDSPDKEFDLSDTENAVPEAAGPVEQVRG